MRAGGLGHEDIKWPPPDSSGRAGLRTQVRKKRVAEMPLQVEANTRWSAGASFPSESGMGRLVNTSRRREKTAR